ncbi:MAG: hypothetical protein WCP31_06885 [Chloroflexales bacterium]
MNMLFLNLEWGQVYGSYQGHFIPIEIGGILAKKRSYHLCFESKKCYYDINLVVRRNKIDTATKTTGFSEMIVNTGKGECQQLYDPDYKLSKKNEIAARRMSQFAVSQLGSYLTPVLQQHDVHQLVVFGGAQDLQLLQQANVILAQIEIIDVQQVIQRTTHHCFSLDKISFIMGFHSDTKWFGTKRLRYPIPLQYQYHIKTHQAIGDACRIYSTYQEFMHNRVHFMQECKKYLCLYGNDKGKVLKTSKRSLGENNVHTPATGHTIMSSPDDSPADDALL